MASSDDLDVKRLRAEAERCRRLADQIPDRGLRALMRHVAWTFDAIADQAQRSGDGQTPGT